MDTRKDLSNGRALSRPIKPEVKAKYRSLSKEAVRRKEIRAIERKNSRIKVMGDELFLLCVSCKAYRIITDFREDTRSKTGYKLDCRKCEGICDSQT